jgi:hypothetical protein
LKGIHGSSFDYFGSLDDKEDDKNEEKYDAEEERCDVLLKNVTKF